MATNTAPIPGTRAIARRSSGNQQGPITRLISPGDLGEQLKPFVFLDLFEIDAVRGGGFAPHPHSGIATLTVFLEGSMSYADSTGERGSLHPGSVEWMLAGGGIWHAGRPDPGHAMRGFQLWVSLPPALELAEPDILYLEARDIPAAGPARVLLGTYEGVTGPIPAPAPMTYLHVRLADGDRWTFNPGDGHDVAWLATNRGNLHVGSTVLKRELAIFADGDGPIEMVAVGDAEMVIGSAVRHPYPLVTGHYSVHTSAQSLREGERAITALAATPAVASLNLSAG